MACWSSLPVELLYRIAASIVLSPDARDLFTFALIDKLCRTIAVDIARSIKNGTALRRECESKALLLAQNWS